MSSFIAEILIFSSVLLLMVIVAQLVCLRQSAAMKYRIWMSSIIGLLILPVFCLFLPRWFSSQKHDSEVVETVVHKTMPPMLQEYVDFTPFQQPLQQPVVYEPQIPVFVPEMLPMTLSMETTEIENTDTAAVPLPPEPPELKKVMQSQDGNDFLLTVLLLTWSLGVMIGLLLLGRSFVVVRKQLREASPVEKESLAAICDFIAEKLALHKKMRLLVGENIRVPLVTGCFRPVILLPKACLDWSDEKLCAVLIHELAHIKRNDIFRQILVRLVGSFYWFHPLVWLAAWRIREEREAACDDMVLLYGQQPSFYADVLLGIASHATGRSHSYGCAVAMARSSRIERRIRSILAPGKNRSPVRRVTVVLVGLFVLGIVSVSVTLSPFAPPMLFQPTPVIAEEQTVESIETDETIEQETAPSEALSPETRKRLLELYEQQYQAAVRHEETIKVRYESGHVQGTIYAMQDAICRRCVAEMDRLEFLIEIDSANAETHHEKLRAVCRELLEATKTRDQAAEATFEVGKISSEEFTRSQRDRYDLEIRVIRLFPDMAAGEDENETVQTDPTPPQPTETDRELQILMSRSEMENAVYQTMQDTNEKTHAVSYMELRRQHLKCLEAQLAVIKHEQTVYGMHEGENFDRQILQERYNLAKEEYEIAQATNERALNAVSEVEILQLYQKVQEAQLNLEKHAQSIQGNQHRDKTQSQLSNDAFEKLSRDRSYFNSKRNAIEYPNIERTYLETFEVEREYRKLAHDETATLDDFIRVKKKAVQIESAANVDQNPLVNKNSRRFPMSGLLSASEYDILRLIKMKREKTLSRYLLGREIEGDDPDERYRLLKLRCEQLKDVDKNDVRAIEKIQAQQDLLYTKIEKILNIYERDERWKTFEGVERIWFDMFTQSMQELQTATQQEIDFFSRIDWEKQQLKTAK